MIWHPSGLKLTSKMIGVSLRMLGLDVHEPCKAIKVILLAQRL